jgi:4-amino-4-deoxy-L-arabinose transferase-like glycosyltransferase
MNQSRPPQTRRDAWVEAALVVVLVLAAAFFRFRLPDEVPPGPSHDELRMMELGELIVEGERPIHWTVSYSAEPLFMYALALAMPALGFTPFGARIVTRLPGLLLIPLVHILTRRLFGRRVALVTSGVLAITWWPVFFSRVALRGITLPLTLVAAVTCLWQGLGLNGGARTHRLGQARWGWLALGGGLVGLTWYTFTAARGLFILLPALLSHLALLRAVPIRRLWRIALVTLGLAALVAAPFVYDMQVHPGAPEARMQQLGGVIKELRAGHFGPFVRQTFATLGMFTLTGEPNWRYNVSGRPVFGPVLGGLATLGLLVSIGRWRQPRYVLVIFWLIFGLAPSMLTPDAPSLVRAIGALPAAAMLPGIGAEALLIWLPARFRQQAGPARPDLFQKTWLLVALVVIANGCSTFRNLFVIWPGQPQVREIYQASLTEAFGDLNRSDLEGQVWISEPFPDDRHLLLARRLLQREEIKPRWFDGQRALILPPVDGTRYYMFADFANPDPELFAHWMSGASVFLERRANGGTGEPIYQVYQVEGGPWVERGLADITARSTAFADLEAEQPVPLPARFGEVAILLGYELAKDHVATGDEVHLVLYWRARGPAYEPLSSFAHVLDSQSNVVGQYDGFDVPPRRWKAEDVIAQVYRFSVSPDAQPGAHWLEVGLYNPQTMVRVPILDEKGALLGDRLLLQEVMVQ